jgi:hypothetical protein
VTKKVPYEGVYCDTRMGGVEKYYLNCKPANADMRIPDEYLKGVCFLCVRIPGSGEHASDTDEFIGTAFMVGVSTRFPAMKMFCLVTAKHIIDHAREAGHVEIYVRMNTDDGSSITFELPDQWLYSENPATDVAVMFIPIQVVAGHTMHSVAMENFATDEVIEREDIGIGDDVFAIGLFNQKWGDERNIPIMRTGIIASMPQEPLEAIDSEGRYVGTYNAYLVELRSIGGLSGSPVFVNLDFWRLGPNMLESKIELGGFTIRRKMHLLGMIRGHWDLERQNAARDRSPAATDDEEIDRLNTGIAIVTPIQEVLDVLNGEAAMKIREKAEAKFAKRRQPTGSERRYFVDFTTTYEYNLNAL